MSTNGKRTVPQQYADRPNLWRLTRKLMEFKDPRKAASALILLAGNVQGEKGGAA